jgi:protein-disulfide isomerase
MEFLRQFEEGKKVRASEKTVKVDVTYDRARLRGSPEAPVIIVEFSDFQCPFCRRVQETLRNLLEKYQGQVSLGYRDFPLRELHPESDLAAEASRCAGERGKFWEYHDLLFGNPGQLNSARAIEFARSLGLNVASFDSCVSSAKYKKQIERDIQDGIRAGVTGTPGIFINGLLISGAQPEAVFEKAIAAELASYKDKHARR